MAIDRVFKLYSMGVGTLAEVAANTSAEQLVTVPAGVVAVGDFIQVNKPTAQAGIGIVGARVASATTVGITFMNTTAAGVTPTASEDYLCLIVRP